MEHLDEVIGIIFIIIAIIFAVKFVVFLFTNYLISRILSIVISLAQIIMAFGISGKVDMLGDFMFSAIVLTALAWLFFIGPNVFDIEWDGSFDIRETFSGYRATPHMTGGFISNAIGALIIII
jgi:hypothetical protein